jgi:hypothetical protein
MPLDPPVMTATLPSSFAMTSFFKFRFWSSEEDAETPEMGLKTSGFQCGSAHIGGAKTIRLDAERAYDPARTAVRWVQYRIWKAQRGARLHHDRLG